MENIKPSSDLAKMLDWILQNGASDLHCEEGKPLRYRKHGNLELMPEEFVAPAENQTSKFLNDAFGPETTLQIQNSLELDLSVSLEETRFRANFSKQQARQSISFRIVPRQTSTLEDLQLPPTIFDLVSHPRGLVLVTGPTGQGKSTTLRALIEEINLTQNVRIITIEDPIEFVFTEKQAMIGQREVGIDTKSFADGIRNAMRQDPNIIFIGEIRDAESVFAAMQAAETGHLVLTTLHADSVAQALGRIREFYPVSDRDSISSALGRNLNSIICQRLLPNTQGERTPCLEILKRDAGVADAIAANDLSVLNGIVENSINLGMHTFDQYLKELLAAGMVDVETAKAYAVNRHRFEMELAGIHMLQPILRPIRNR